MALLIPGNDRVDTGAAARHLKADSRFVAHPSYEEDDWSPERSQPKREAGSRPFCPC